MHIFSKVLTIACLAAPLTFAQQFFSVGVKAGVPFTDSFSDSNYITNVQGQIVHSFSDAKNYIIGPTVEVHLPLGLSVEADALYRPLNLQRTSVLSSTPLTGTSLSQSGNFSSWEFPILAKYRFAFPLVKPYVEVGPSFRTLGGVLSDHLSNNGITAGVGVELRVARLRIGPEVRYTRWGSDSGASAQGFSSRQDQGEFLVGFSF